MLPVRIKYSKSELESIKVDSFVSPVKVSYVAMDGDSIQVKNEAYVFLNQLLIVRSNGIKVYSSISGKVSIKGNNLVILNDNKENNIRKDKYIKNIRTLSKDKMLDRIKSLGISYQDGLLSNVLDSGKEVLVFNTMDMELYQFSNRYTLLDNFIDILNTIDVLRKEFDLLVYIIVNYDDIEIRNKIASVIRDYPLMEVKYIGSDFPDNYNTVIYKKYLNIYDFDKILFLDPLITYKIYMAIKYNSVLSERYVTLWSNEGKNINVIKVKYGTSLKTLVEYCYGNKGCSYYLNNIYRRVVVKSLDYLRVNDKINSVYVSDMEATRESKCINCGKCYKVCPMGIDPVDPLDKLKDECLKCGLCNYVCPSNINLISMEGRVE